MTDKNIPLALVTGVGPGTGAATVRRFAEGGYRVAMIARDADRLTALARAIPNSVAMPCDVTDEAALAQVIVEVGQPFTATPSNGVWSCAERHNSGVTTCSNSGSMIARSASEPTAMVPFLGYRLKTRAGLADATWEMRSSEILLL